MSFDLGSPRTTNDANSDYNFKILFDKLNEVVGVSKKASTTRKFYPFGKKVNLYFEWTPSTSLFQLWIDDTSRGRWNV